MAAIRPNASRPLDKLKGLTVSMFDLQMDWLDSAAHATSMADAMSRMRTETLRTMRPLVDHPNAVSAALGGAASIGRAIDHELARRAVRDDTDVARGGRP